MYYVIGRRRPPKADVDKPLTVRKSRATERGMGSA
jgi:hypothetical protein